MAESMLPKSARLPTIWVAIVLVLLAALTATGQVKLGAALLIAAVQIGGIGWLAGFALRERAEEAEAAEARAARAEREREVAMRIAVAEERARIARELHDIVAHAVSVMVLQVGAVRHKLPQTLEEDSEALRRVEQAGRTALAEMRRLLGAMRRDSDEPDQPQHSHRHSVADPAARDHSRNVYRSTSVTAT